LHGRSDLVEDIGVERCSNCLDIPTRRADWFVAVSDGEGFLGAGAILIGDDVDVLFTFWLAEGASDGECACSTGRGTSNGTNTGAESAGSDASDTEHDCELRCEV